MDALMGFLEEMGCSVETVGDGALWTWIAGTHGRHCLRVSSDGDYAQVQVLAPLRVPAERDLPVRQLLSQLNAAAHPACFELDSDGELRCRCLAEAGPRGLSIRRVRNAVLAAVRAMDSHLCRIEAVVAGVSPDQFIRS